MADRSSFGMSVRGSMIVPFTRVKFRTMRAPRRGSLVPDRRAAGYQAGSFPASSRIDKLPELWNVLCGDMSRGGPRPLLTEHLDQYTPEQRRRHDVRHGFTGWAAVHGRHALKFDCTCVIAPARSRRGCFGSAGAQACRTAEP
jgi:lipopolysaccharide/colanic/teichoic acid biosynthesis glycosyltransferase